MSRIYVSSNVFKKYLTLVVCLIFFILLFVLTGKVSAQTYVANHQNKATWDAECSSRVPAWGVYGFTFIDPSSVTIDASGTGSATMYNYLCNASSGTVTGNYVYYGDNFVTQTGRRPAIDFSTSGLVSTTYGGEPYSRLTMVNQSNSADAVSSGQSKLVAWPISFNGSTFDAAGDYTVSIKGFGEIYSTTQGQGTTNTVYTPYNIRVNRPAADPAPTCSASPGSRFVGDNITFTGSGGNGQYSWEAPPDGDPSNRLVASPNSFVTRYGSPGTKIVTVTSDSRTADCSVTIAVNTLKPYLRVFGGDVQAGSGFGEGCTASNTSAKIRTFNRGSGGSYLGAGTNMAAFALGNISGFASAKGGTSAKSLSFSSTVGDANYGGAFGQTYCAANYWADAPTSPVPPSSMTISTTNVADGAHQVVYVDGDATITGNIVYSGSGGWTNLNQIPSYYLIVRGNIYIDKSVSQLDGVFIAMPDTSNNRGIIYTCTNGSTPYGANVPTTIPPSGGCGSKLTINGAFIAKKVRFLRTNGEVSQAAAGETSASTNIAEVFVYGPEIWAR